MLKIVMGLIQYVAYLDVVVIVHAFAQDQLKFGRNFSGVIHDVSVTGDQYYGEV